MSLSVSEAMAGIFVFALLIVVPLALAMPYYPAAEEADQEFELVPVDVIRVRRMAFPGGGGGFGGGHGGGYGGGHGGGGRGGGGGGGSFSSSQSQASSSSYGGGRTGSGSNSQASASSNAGSFGGRKHG